MNGTTSTQPIVSLSEATAGGLALLAADERMVSVYYRCSFGDVAVTRTGTYLAVEYDAGIVGC